MLSLLRERFGRQHTVVTGLDIGTYSIKLLQLSRTATHYQIEHYAELGLTHSHNISAVVKQLIDATQKSVKNVVLGLPDTAVISKVIQLEVEATLDDSELATQILFAAEQHVPYPLEEISLDFQVLGRHGNHPQQLDVLLVAAHKTKVEQVVAASGLAVAVVDVESFALERSCMVLADAWPDQCRQRTVALLNIGSVTTTLILFQDRQVIFTHNEMLVDQQLTPELTLAQFKRGREFFFASHPQSKIDHLVLAGDGAQLPDLVNYFSAHLEISVALANPFANMLCAAEVDVSKLAKVAPYFVQACGLALHDLVRKG